MPQTFNLASDISSTDPVDLPESLVYPFLWALGPGAEVAGSLPLEGAANEGERQEEALPGLLVMVPGVLTGGGGEAKACDFIEAAVSFHREHAQRVKTSQP